MAKIRRRAFVLGAFSLRMGYFLLVPGRQSPCALLFPRGIVCSGYMNITHSKCFAKEGANAFSGVNVFPRGGNGSDK